MLKLVAGLAAVPVALLTAVAAPGVLVVDVRESGKDGHHLVVPVPIVVARAALAFAPQERLRVDIAERVGEPAEKLAVAREVIAALAKAEDGELVRVEERDATVLVEKKGDVLHVIVDDRGEHVEVSVPFDMALKALPDDSGRISVQDVLASLSEARFRTLAEVRSRDGEHVKVSLW
jgi:hypothetical protein